LTDSAQLSGAGDRHMIRGERVFLRAAERADLSMFVRWLNDAETASFITNRAPMSQAMEEQWFDKLLVDHAKTRWFFVICLLEGGVPIGTTGLFDVDHVNGSAGFGIIIGEKKLWGQGYGGDALNAIIDFGFGELRLERIWLDVYDFNSRARRSYEKAGFTLEGTQRHATFQNGRYLDLVLMSILREDWLALPRKRGWDY
jgi:diamine N-acetyltransferase